MSSPLIDGRDGDVQALGVGVPTFTLRGLHDGTTWMADNGVRGWVVEPLYSHGNLKEFPLIDARAFESEGIRMIIRLNYSYAKGDGGLGTFPTPDRYPEFIDWCLRIITRSKGVWGWIIGNEPNRAAERPDPDTAITPANVVYLYNKIWYNARLDDRISPPAPDPTNYESGDPREYWRQIIVNLSGAEFFALHAYSYTHQQAVDSSRRFGPPMAWQYYSFRMWEPLAAVLYNYRRDGGYPWRTRPIIITETNHLFVDHNGGTLGWNSAASPWIRDVYDYVRRWNAGPGDQYVHGICLYRHHGDAWRLDDKPQLLETLRTI